MAWFAVETAAVLTATLGRNVLLAFRAFPAFRVEVVVQNLDELPSNDFVAILAFLQKQLLKVLWAINLVFVHVKGRRLANSVVTRRAGEAF